MHLLFSVDWTSFFIDVLINLKTFFSAPWFFTTNRLTKPHFLINHCLQNQIKSVRLLRIASASSKTLLGSGWEKMLSKAQIRKSSKGKFVFHSIFFWVSLPIPGPICISIFSIRTHKHFCTTQRLDSGVWVSSFFLPQCNPFPLRFSHTHTLSINFPCFSALLLDDEKKNAELLHAKILIIEQDTSISFPIILIRNQSAKQTNANPNLGSVPVSFGLHERAAYRPRDGPWEMQTPTAPPPSSYGGGGVCISRKLDFLVSPHTMGTTTPVGKLSGKLTRKGFCPDGPRRRRGWRLWRKKNLVQK